MAFRCWRPTHLALRSIVSTQQDASQLVEQGKALYDAGDFEAAVPIWRQAAEAFASQGDGLNQAMALSNLSLTHQQLGQWNEARQAIAESLNLSTAQEKTPAQLRILAQTLDIQGNLQRSTGQAAAALDTWRRTASLYEKLGDETGVTQSQINQSQALQDLGLYLQAKSTLEEALKATLETQPASLEEALKAILETQPASLSQAKVLLSLGNTLRIVGDLKDSQAVLHQSWLVARALPSPHPQTENAILLSLGSTAQALGNRIAQRQQPRQPQMLSALSGGLCRRSQRWRSQRCRQSQRYRRSQRCRQSRYLLPAGHNLLPASRSLTLPDDKEPSATESI